MTRTLKPVSRESKTPEFPIAITSLRQTRNGMQKSSWDMEQHEIDIHSFSQSISAPSGYMDQFAPPIESFSPQRQTLTSNFFTEDEKKKHARDHLQQYNVNKVPVASLGPNVDKMAKAAKIFKARLQDSTVNVKRSESMARAYSLLPPRPSPTSPTAK
jgi:secreted Zn-dependent insulinase-like peptidase